MILLSELLNDSKLKSLKSEINSILTNKSKYPSSTEIVSALESLNIQMTADEYNQLDYSVKPTITNYYKWIAMFKFNMKSYHISTPNMPRVVEKVSEYLKGKK